MEATITIRDAKPEEFSAVGALMVSVYQQLDGFPKADEQPQYYQMLQHVGTLTDKPKTRLLVALHDDQLAGAVVYFGDMRHYGSGGSASQERNSSGFRLLAVDPLFGGKGIGRRLVEYCIALANEANQNQVIIHSTEAMLVARNMYEKMGFQRAEDLDFMQGDLSVYGFKLYL